MFGCFADVVCDGAGVLARRLRSSCTGLIRARRVELPRDFSPAVSGKGFLFIVPGKIQKRALVEPPKAASEKNRRDHLAPLELSVDHADAFIDAYGQVGFKSTRPDESLQDFCPAVGRCVTAIRLSGATYRRARGSNPFLLHSSGL